MTADLHIYRSALNSDEVASLWAGNTYQSSLEVWAPLTGGAKIKSEKIKLMVEDEQEWMKQRLAAGAERRAPFAAEPCRRPAPLATGGKQ